MHRVVFQLPQKILDFQMPAALENLSVHINVTRGSQNGYNNEKHVLLLVRHTITQTRHITLSGDSYSKKQLASTQRTKQRMRIMLKLTIPKFLMVGITEVAESL